MPYCMIGILLSAVLGLAACTNSGGSTGSGYPSQPLLQTRYETGAFPAVAVSVTEAVPAASIVLLSPAGEAYPSKAVSVDRMSRYHRPAGPEFGLGLGIFGGSHSGIGTSVGIGQSWPVGRDPYDYSDLYRSQGRILIPDLAAYRNNWRNWRVRVTFEATGQTPQEITLAAPAPTGAD